MNTTENRHTDPNVGTYTVLIVDDNTANLKVLSNYLTEYGFTILVATDGELALERAEYAQPDIILLDILLPRMDGFEVCRRLKASETTQDIPVIFITALTETGDKIKGLQVGAVDYITKPFYREEVLVRIQTQARVRELTNRLEQKVQERTSELLAAVAEAQQLNRQLKRVNDELTREIAERKRTENLLRAQHDLALKLGITVGLEETLRLCVETAIQSTEMNAGGVYLVDEMSGDVDLAFATGLSPEFIQATSHYEADSPQAHMVMANEPIYISYDQMDIPEDDIRRREGLYGLAILPVHHKGQIIACLNIASHTVSEISADTRTVLETIAAQIGSFVARARTEKALLDQTYALRESEERYRNLVETTPDPVVLLQDGFYQFVSPAFTQVFGYTQQDVDAGLSFFDLVQESDKAAVQKRYEDRLAGKPVPKTFRIDLVAKDGTLVPCETSSTLTWPKGYPTDLMTIRDVTERVQAEEERERLLVQIQEQVQQMQQIMDTVPEGVLLLDANGRVLQANPMAEKNLTVLANANVGEIITHLSDRPLEEFLTSLPQGLWHNVIVKEQSFQVIARSIEAGPVSGGWLLVIRDVTQQREFERRIQQQERLASVGQLAAGIAHDFNNVMATIVLYAQMTARMQELPDRVRERMTTINQQAQHATNLIRQILDFSRRSVFERHPFDLLPFLKEQVQLLERTLPESIAIELDYGPDEYTINADPTRMQQMVTNLAVNARDAMPEGGMFHIELERVEIKSHHELPLPEMHFGEWVQMIVSDTGSGIPPDALPHIFDPFFTTKEPGEGSGLGLAQVHGIVGQHEGHITVDTWLGKGTSFTVYLPTLPAHLPEPSNLELESLVTGQEETILVVEDNITARKAMVESLTLLNYRAMEATNGHEALEILEQHSDEIVLVVSDVVMPKMGGIALFHAMRERGLKVPMLMLTGHSMEKELENLQTQGLSGWLFKPPNLEDLARAVSQALKEANS